MPPRYRIFEPSTAWSYNYTPFGYLFRLLAQLRVKAFVANKTLHLQNL
jgi:hypothetical protein